MVRLLSVVILSCVAGVAMAAAKSAPQTGFKPEIAFEKHILPNGLTLIVHQDRKAPIVAVNVWYHIGSKDERPGRTGFAHLFEHLMFNGSENHDDEFFRPLEAVGASKMNGTTWYDRTNYFQNVPTPALDLALFLESDRMGHLLGAITQDKLDAQRGVVLNEKRQGENQPYGRMSEMIAAATYPAGHPYSWTSIGSEADLNAATLDDVKQWFSEHYGAANAVLVIAGDVEFAEVKDKVMHYFGDIPAGPPLPRHGPWVAKMKGIKRAILEDRVPQARVTKVWNVPGFCEKDANILSLASSVLAGSKTSRLYERLVYRDRLATSVSAHLGPFEIASQFTIDALVAPGVDPAQVERAIDEELARFLEQGPTDAELARVRTGLEADFVRGLETIDGFGGKSATLAQYEVYCGAPDWFKREFEWIAAATPVSVRDTARAWLSDGQYVLTVTPFPDYRVAQTRADRSKLPVVGALPALELPPPRRDRLSNDIELVVVERDAAPIVQLGLIFDAGYAADAAEKSGTARMTLDMLSEGAGKFDSLGLARLKEELAVEIGAQSNLDTSVVLMNSLSNRLPESLDLLADIVLRPSFPEHELQRLKQQGLASIQQEKSQPQGLVTRVYPQLIYGPGHAYAGTRSGSGTEASVGSLEVDDLRRFQSRWLRPDNVRILVVGDTTLAQIKPLLEKAFGRWKAPSEPVPEKNLATVEMPTQPRLFLLDKPGAAQTMVLAAHLAPPKSDPDDAAMNLASTVLGGLFVSRLNMNLREDKHWSYGASAVLGSARGQRPFVVYSQVQADRTADSVQEMLKELNGIIDDRPVTPQELKLAADNLVVGLPGDNETSSDVASSYLNILQYDLPDSYYNDLVPKVQGLTPEQVHAAARKLIQPQALTWVVVGDLSQVEAPLRELKLGPVAVIDSEGRVIR
ncbi:M16 family metallopeptidase [Panacagrimonas sp.]|uniref:M16 family metallopeptidase n=1 Tax=Panacagrimonas sp. TaxID=2480088 RepID=UPI003B524DE1